MTGPRVLARVRASLARATAGVDDELVAPARPVGRLETLGDAVCGAALFGAMFAALWLPSWLGGLS